MVLYGVYKIPWCFDLKMRQLTGQFALRLAYHACCIIVQLSLITKCSQSILQSEVTEDRQICNQNERKLVKHPVETPHTVP